MERIRESFRQTKQPEAQKAEAEAAACAFSRRKVARCSPQSKRRCSTATKSRGNTRRRRSPAPFLTDRMAENSTPAPHRPRRRPERPLNAQRPHAPRFSAMKSTVSPNR